MISGREPIRSLRLCSVILMLCAPAVCIGQDKPPAQDNSWISPRSAKPAAAPPAVAPKPEAPSTQPNATRETQVADESTNEDFAEDTAMHWPEEAAWGGVGWDDYDHDGTPVGVHPNDEPRSVRSRTRAPEYSLWVGAGLGWTLPFGSLWGSCSQLDAYGQCIIVDSVPTHDYIKPGPAAELDLGARLARHYNLYGLWEHSWLGAGSATSAARGQPDHGDTDFLALGLRVSTNPNDLGFILDIAVGTRRMRAVWSDGTELQMTEAPFETRLGLGADVRMGERWSLMPMIALGLGSFGKVQWVNPDHSVQRATQPEDVALTHGWVGLQMAAHADIFGTR